MDRKTIEWPFISEEVDIELVLSSLTMAHPAMIGDAVRMSP